MMKRIEEIKALLDAAQGISDYRINTVKTESNELFFVHKALETVRSTDTTDIKVTVFVAHDGKLGEASFSVYASYGEDKLRQEIENAKKKAALISNEAYPLPAGETGVYESSSNFQSYTTAQLATAISDAAFAADCYEDGSINALEVFIYRDTVHVLNSRGIDKTEVKYRAMVEAIPTWNGGEESVELYACCNFTEFSPESLRQELDSKMREVRDRLAAKKPEQKLSCNVVLTAPELEHLFGNLASELNYSSIYNHANAFAPGDDIQKAPSGDTLTVTMCGQLKGSVGSAAFDRDGCTLTDRKIIENGKAVSAYGATRYASYLEKEPTGDLRCIHAAAGTMEDCELSAAPYFKCVSMSGLQLDIYSDYIGGEVRLAYYFDGEKEIPVTGISISGKLSQALRSMRLSSQEVTREDYTGPKFACFSNMEIV